MSEKFEIRPRIVLSRCLNIAYVRYNGGIIENDFTRRLMNYVDYVSVCPEVDIGMSVPRPLVVLYKKGDSIRMIEPSSMRDYTDDILSFADRFLVSVGEVDGFVLKSKSPSCGIKDAKIYQENLIGLINAKSNGLFAQKVIERFSYLPVESEGRLNDYWIRRDFLTKIFSFARLRYLKSNCKDINDLMRFHQQHKYLLMLYDPNSLKRMGNMVGNWKKYGLEITLKVYVEMFYKAFSRRSNIKKHANVIQHILGHFSKKVNQSEKKHLHVMLEKFMNNSLHLEVLLEYIRGFIYRFDDEYLASQFYLNPFPEELIL
jgi:uncharacterized protein YbbK (DUF523 family)/uncharacterized protein YbgA (DUF1722 family)